MVRGVRYVVVSHVRGGATGTGPSMSTTQTKDLPLADEDASFLSVADLARRWGVSRTSARNVTSSPDFPTPLVLGTQLLRWPAGEVDEWQTKSRRAPHRRLSLRAARRPSGRHLVVAADRDERNDASTVRLVERRRPVRKAA